MDASFHIKPFAFDRVFAMPAAAAPVGRAEDLHLQLLSLEAEVERMRLDHATALAQARDDGLEAGLRQARGEQGAALLAAVDALGSRSLASSGFRRWSSSASRHATTAPTGATTCWATSSRH